MTAPTDTHGQEIARVVMLWPADLKKEIQAEVGKRGLTQYVLEAVREKRGLPPRTAAPAPISHPVPVEQRLQDGVAPPVAHTGHVCATCGIELPVGESCWVCG